jgi:1-acyl-sn-glycerol-3-phosphate acyltransferase
VLRQLAAAPGRRRRPWSWLGRVLRHQLGRAIVVGALLVILPGVALAEKARHGAGRRVARRGVLAVSRLLRVTYCVEGDLASWPARRIVVANHSSLLDVPALLVALPEARFLAAADLYRIPLLSSALRAMGSLPVDRHHPREGRRQIAGLAADLEGTLVVFPQGAIASRGALRFKTGAFQLAVDAGAAVCPIAISGADLVLPPGSRLRIGGGEVRLALLAPILEAGSADGTAQERRALRDRAEAAVLAALDPP